MKRLVLMLFSFWVSLSNECALANCSAAIQDAYAWAAKKDGRNRYYVQFLISSMKAPTKFVHYSDGNLTIDSEGQLDSGNTSAIFSDRAWCPNNSGPFCLPYQKFDYRKADEMTFKLQRNGVLQVTLNSWGNAIYNVNLQCSNGFMYGTLAEPSGSSFITLNLNNTFTEIPR